MANNLVAPDALSGFPGAPFTDAVVDAAVASLRRTAGWHVAPSLTETVTLDGSGGTRLILDTLRLTAVTEARNVLEATPSIIDVRWSKVGVLAGYFPWGFRSVEVDMTHGYDACPPDLLPLIANACQRIKVDPTVASQGAGPFTVTFRDVDGATQTVVDPGLARYVLPPRP